MEDHYLQYSLLPHVAAVQVPHLQKGEKKDVGRDSAKEDTMDIHVVRYGSCCYDAAVFESAFPLCTDTKIWS